jgi:hypothetical protein
LTLNEDDKLAPGIDETALGLLPCVECDPIVGGLEVRLHAIHLSQARDLVWPALWRALAFTAFQARALLGGSPFWLVTVRRPNGLPALLFAHLHAGRLRAGLTVTMVGPMLAPHDVWPVVDAIALRVSATAVQVEVVSTNPDANVPLDPHETSRFRGERLYVVDLEPGCMPDANFSKNTKRNIAKGAKGGLAFFIGNDDAAFQRHLLLTNASMDRRGRRGEDVSERASSERMRRLLKHGQGHLFQAVRDGVTLSSDFVFRCAGAAFYYDGGSSPEGMEVGSSHFLMANLLARLHAEGYGAVNLGLARAGNDGLARFKEGFGARLVHVERVTARRETAARLIRNLFGVRESRASRFEKPIKRAAGPESKD